MKSQIPPPFFITNQTIGFYVLKEVELNYKNKTRLLNDIERACKRIRDIS